MRIISKLHKGLYYIFAKLLALFIVFIFAQKLGGFAQYAKEMVKLLIAAQIIVSGGQLLLQQAADKISRLAFFNVIGINFLASILYVKIAGLEGSLVWGMVFLTCVPIIIAYNAGKNGGRGEILNILSIVMLQPLIYCSYKSIPVDLMIIRLDCLVVILFFLVLLFIRGVRKVPQGIRKNCAWRTAEVALTQGVLLYFAEKLLHKSTSDQIITYWVLMQVAGGVIFLANSFSYSIINYFLKVGAIKNNVLVMLYKMGAFSMGVLLLLAIKAPYVDMYYGVFLIVQGVMKFPGYALLGQSKSHVLFKSNVSSFVLMLIFDSFVNFNSFEAYVQIQMAAALTATLLSYFQLRKESSRLIAI